MRSVGSTKFTSLGELYFGAAGSLRAAENLQIIERFLDAVLVVGMDLATAQIYGRVSDQLAGNGTPIPQNDIWIAAVAIQHGLPLATIDKHFRNIEGLRIISSPEDC